MRSILSPTATTLALLALSLQVVVGALGGKLCLRMSHFLQSGACAIACCEHDESSEQCSSAGSELSISSQAFPITSDCCLEINSDFLAQAADQSDLRSSHRIVNVAAIATFDRFSAVQGRARAAADPAPNPPASLAIVRTTILLM